MSSERDVEFGLMMSATVGQPADTNPEAFRRLATTAEALGFDALWAGDHVVVPEDLPQEYPYHPDGVPPFDVTDHIYEVFGVLDYLAGLTDDLLLGPNVCIAPYRHPLTLLRSAVTLDALSDGRFEFGVGAGWLRTEFEALDVPFEERGGRTDELLALFHRACEGGPFDFDGPYHSFDTVSLSPTPSERPPVWIGGQSGAAFRRIAEFGDGWTTVWDRPEQVAAGLDRLRRAWADYDRDGDPEVSVMRSIHVGTDTDLDDDRPLVGDVDDVIADVEAYAEAGTTRITVEFFTTDVDEQVEQLRRFGEQVLPSF